jgi:hypothetical protein
MPNLVASLDQAVGLYNNLLVLPVQAWDKTGRELIRSESMKTNSSFMALLILCLTVTLQICGCASASTEKGVYPTLKDTQRNVDWPMTRYRNAVSAGVVTRGEQDQVNSIFARYQAAFQAAVQAAHSNYEITTPDNVKTLANELIAVLSALPF